MATAKPIPASARTRAVDIRSSRTAPAEPQPARRRQCALCAARATANSAQRTTQTLRRLIMWSNHSSSKGNIEYWYCSACKKYFSNKGCTKEISKADTVIDKAAPEIIGGKGSKWSKASKNTIKFKIER